MPHDKDHVLATVHKGSARHVEQAIKAAAEAWEDWHRTPWEDRAAVFLRAAELLSGPVALDSERRDDARPVEDRAPGRDRRRLRAHGLLPLQRAVHAADLRGAAELRARDLEPDGVPAARRLRLRRHAVQLHGDRREPPGERGADGQHGRLEARVDRGVFGALPDEAVRGGRPAARRDQSRLRLGLRDRRSRSRKPRPRPASTSPARRPSSSRCGRRSARTSRTTATIRASSARPAARTSSSRIPPPTRRPSRRRSSAGASSTRARNARPPRASSRRRTSGPRSGNALVEEVAHDQDGRRHRLPELHGRGDRRRLVQDAEGGDRGGKGGSTRSKVLVGGGYDDSEGYFVEPTVLETTDPNFRTMREELFGPVVTTYVYPEGKYGETLDLDRPGRALRPDRRRLRARTRRARARRREAPVRGRELLRQRQAHRGGRRPAALRRARASGHERQGRLDVEPDPLGEPAHDQGDVRAADATIATRSWRPTTGAARSRR